MPRFGKLVQGVALLVVVFCVGAAGASAASLPSGMTWSGDLSTGDYSQYHSLEQCPGDITQVGSPAPAGARAVQLRVSDTDTETACPGQVFTPNPAASLLGPTVFHNGDDAYIGFSVYFPAGFPTIPTWFQFAEIFGHPYGGSPPIGLDVEGNRMGLWRDATHNFDNPWSVPLVTGQWQDLVLHVKFSNDPNAGFVEVWLNGAPQQFSDGSTRLYYSTLVAGNNWDGGSGGDYLDIDQYRSRFDHLGTVTIDEAEMAIGTSYAGVAPRLHDGIVSAPTTAPAAPAPATTPATKPVGAHTSRAPKPAKHKAKKAKKAKKKHAARALKHRKHRKHPLRRPTGGLGSALLNWLQLF